MMINKPDTSPLTQKKNAQKTSPFPAKGKHYVKARKPLPAAPERGGLIDLHA